MAPSRQRYGDGRSNSGVTSYEPGPDYLLVWFRNEPNPYRYSHARAGERHVEQMKWLAASGRGLTTYINKYVHELHDR